MYGIFIPSKYLTCEVTTCVAAPVVIALITGSVNKKVAWPSCSMNIATCRARVCALARVKMCSLQVTEQWDGLLLINCKVNEDWKQKSFEGWMQLTMGPLNHLHHLIHITGLPDSNIKLSNESRLEETVFIHCLLPWSNTWEKQTVLKIIPVRLMLRLLFLWYLTDHLVNTSLSIIWFPKSVMSIAAKCIRCWNYRDMSLMLNTA